MPSVSGWTRQSTQHRLARYRKQRCFRRDLDMSDSWRTGLRYRADDEIIGATKQVVAAFFSSTEKFYVNPDLDGFLSAAILRQVLSWKPVGIAACNGTADDSFWTTAGPGDELEAVFVDIWIHPQNIKVIDQHITAYDERHHARLSRNALKVNPNLLWPRMLRGSGSQAYQWKYPFGVVHFIIASLESLGHVIDIKGSESTDFGNLDLLLRADDAARTTATNYRPNALCWWDFLVRLGGPVTRQLADYAIHTAPEQVSKRQACVEQHLADRLRPVGRGSRDGGLAELIPRAGGWTPEMQRYLDGLLKSTFATPAPVGFSGPLRRVRLSGKRTHPGDPNVPYVLEDSDLFAYAFTTGVGNIRYGNGFSYTTHKAPADTSSQG